jgi:hypothetical protein
VPLSCILMPKHMPINSFPCVYFHSQMLSYKYMRSSSYSEKTDPGWSKCTRLCTQANTPIHNEQVYQAAKFQSCILNLISVFQNTAVSLVNGQKSFDVRYEVVSLIKGQKHIPDDIFTYAYCWWRKQKITRPSIDFFYVLYYWSRRQKLTPIDIFTYGCISL